MRPFARSGSVANRVIPPQDGLQSWLEIGESTIGGGGTTVSDLASIYNWIGTSYSAPSGTAYGLSAPHITTDQGKSVIQTAYNNLAYQLTPGPFRLANQFGITNSTGYTIVYLLRQRSATTHGTFYFPSLNGTFPTSAARGIASHTTWVDGNIYFDQAGCCAADQRISASGGDMTTNYNAIFFVADASQGQRRLYKNTTNIADSGASSTAAINLSGSYSPEILNSSEYAGLGGNYSDHYFGAFLCYNRPLSTSEISNVCTYFKNQGWNLP